MIRDDAVMQIRNFSDINLEDVFFESLKTSYKEFGTWFISKAKEKAFVVYGDSGGLEGFLYLKTEQGPITDIQPSLNVRGLVVKVGTFKINAHGTKLGERFVKKIFDFAIENNASYIYVTVFKQHRDLIGLLQQYGFQYGGTKTTPSGVEGVFHKNFVYLQNDPQLDYPIINLHSNKWLLSVFPRYHTGLFPDSRLHTENPSVVEDLGFTNSIHKVYVGRARDFGSVQKGDILVIYRTKEDGAPNAEYSAVATSLCVVEEIRNKDSFSDKNDFLNYCLQHSVFDASDLAYWYSHSGSDLHAVKMTYNIAMPKRIIRKILAEQVGLNRDERWTLLKLTDNQFNKIIKLGDVYEGAIIR